MPDFRTRLEQELVQAAGRPHRVRYAGTPIPGPGTIAAGAVAIAILACTLIVGDLRTKTHGDEVAAIASGATAKVISAFPALQQPARRADAMPAGIQSQLAVSADNRDAIRSFTAPTGTGYLVPSETGLCITIPDPVDGFGIGCQTTAEANQRGVLVVMMQGAARDGLTVAFATPADTTLRALAADGSPAKTQTTTNANGIFAGVVPFGTVFEVSGPQGKFKQTLPGRLPTDFSDADVKHHLGEPLKAR
jgi:hypothetical protein